MIATKILSSVMLSFVLVSGNTVTAVEPAYEPAPDTVMCAEIYAPVCGEVEVQCIDGPCDPVYETFGNTCEANAAGATNITDGSCLEILPIETSSEDVMKTFGLEREYMSTSEQKCRAIDFVCDEEARYFFDRSGCGCEEKPVHDFETCEESGGDIQESFPRKCVDSDGQTYTEKV